MWLAAGTRQHGMFVNYYINTPISRAGSFYGHVFTYMAGYYVIQVVALRWRKVTRRNARSPFIPSQAPIWEGYSLPLWPSEGSPLKWPPVAHLSDHLLHQFRDRWSESPVRVITRR